MIQQLPYNLTKKNLLLIEAVINRLSIPFDKLF